MWQLMRDLWSDSTKFKGAIRGLVLGLAFAATGKAGSAILEGDLAKVKSGQWMQFAISVFLGTAGGTIALGEKNKKE